MESNGTTLWTRPDPLALPRVMLCNLDINPGESERVARPNKKLEHKHEGDQPSKRFKHSDWSIKGELEPNFTTPADDVFATWCNLFLNGRTLAAGHGLEFEDTIKAPYVIASCDGNWAAGFIAWIRKIKLENITADSDYYFTTTLAVQNNWCGQQFDWSQAAGVPAGLEDFQTEIKAYYDNLSSSPFSGFVTNNPQAIMNEIQKNKRKTKK